MTDTSRDRMLPTWAPRVPQRLIRRFYETDAKAIYDEELIDDVGCALLARCRSFLAANRARAGEVPCPRCDRIVAAFPAARTPRRKILLIDGLIHGFHWYLAGRSGGPTRPVAVNLIEGRLGEVVAFLDGLTYGEGSTEGTRETRAEWDRNIEANRDWYPT